MASGSQNLRMVDVGGKAVTRRKAIASGALRMSKKAYRLLETGKLPKGDPLPAAEVAGILAAKRTPDTIPLCHPVGLTSVGLSFMLDPKLPGVRARCEAVAEAKTGVEMEALSGVSAALLAVYDVVKQVEPALTVEQIRLDVKEGGKSGLWRHPDAAAEADVPERQEIGYRAAVVTVSDRCAAGKAEDKSGPLLSDGLTKLGFAVGASVVIPDERLKISDTIKRFAKTADAVILTGGTGLSPRDVTPEAVADACDRLIPGFGEELRGAGRVATAALSRSTAGQLGKCVVVALPGSTGGVRDGLKVLGELLAHAIHVGRGGDH